MEVRFTPETESRLHDLAAKTGRTPDALVEDAMAGYLEHEAKLAVLRAAIDEGDASGIADGDVFARVRENLRLPRH